jgi:AraC family transcriptional regulator, arabinose operon regulatory protein
MARVKSGFVGERAIILPAQIITDIKKDEFSNLLYITDIGYYPKATFHYRKRAKDEAEQYILIYCIDGSGWFEIDGVKHKVQPNNYFILPKGKSHTYGSSLNNPWTIYWIHFDGEKAGFFSEGLDKPNPVNPERNSRIEHRLNLFEEIFSTLKNGYSKNNLDYSTSSLFHFLGSLKFLGAYRESLSARDKKQDIVDDAIHYMRENIHKKLSLNNIADYIGLSASYFTALFHKKTGHSPLNYFIQLKIQQACHHLDFSDMKVNQISSLIGFDDPFYFSRIFTRVMGLSPSDYRDKKKG